MQQVSDASRSPGYDPAPTNSRALIVDSIRSAGTVSRVELTQITGLTAPSVTTVVRRLIDDGLVDEAGRGSSTGGKPRTLLRIRAAARYVVGVHLSADSLTYVLVDYAGGVVARWRRAGPGEASDPEQVVARIATETTELIERSGIDSSLVLGLGFVCPGPLIRNRGVTSVTLTPTVRPAILDAATRQIREFLDGCARSPEYEPEVGGRTCPFAHKWPVPDRSTPAVWTVEPPEFQLAPPDRPTKDAQLEVRTTKPGRATINYTSRGKAETYRYEVTVGGTVTVGDNDSITWTE